MCMFPHQMTKIKLLVALASELMSMIINDCCVFVENSKLNEADTLTSVYFIFNSREHGFDFTDA